MWQTSRADLVLPGHLSQASGRVYSSPLASGALSTLALSAGTMYAAPFFVPVTTTFTTIGLEVTTLALTKSIQLGIYTDTGSTPNALVLDAGNVSVATTGFKSIVISQALTPGWYWLAVISDGTPTVRAIGQTNSLPWLGFTSGTDVTMHQGWSVAQAYGALPNPFTGGGALMTTAVPRLMLGP